jgi:serine phosphatase RsbU (regulator of sigma subunit)
MNGAGVQVLRRLPLLEGVEAAVLERLAESLTERRFQPGQIVFEEGSTGADVYVIVEGRVQVVKGQGDEEMVLAERGAGDLFGEMGLLERSPRFATIRAVEPTRVLQLPEEGVRSLLAAEPQFLYRTVQLLSARLRQADLHMIADLQRKNQELARAYRDLQEAQAALVEKERLEHELELAQNLQLSILPDEFPQLPGIRCAARSRSARQVGGDFYDVIPLDSERLGLVMADVSDKGMPAAIFMALTRSLIRAEAKRESSPQRVLLNVHQLLLEMSRAEMFVTVFYGVLHPARGSLRYARAGHDLPLLYSHATGESRFLTAAGMALGYVEDVFLEEADEVLRPGDQLVLYTDGILHAESPAGEFYGIERLRETVSSAGAMTAGALCDLVFERVGRFQAGTVQFDDMALLVVSADGAG